MRVFLLSDVLEKFFSRAGLEELFSIASGRTIRPDFEVEQEERSVGFSGSFETCLMPMEALLDIGGHSDIDIIALRAANSVNPKHDSEIKRAEQRTYSA